MHRLGTVAGMLIAAVPLAFLLATSAAGQPAAEGPDGADRAGPSLLGDLVRASGHNLLTGAVGAIAVLALFFRDRLGPRGTVGLVLAAVLLAGLAIGVTFLGTQEALQHERQLAQQEAQQRITQTEARHALAMDAQRRGHDEAMARLGNELERARIDADVALATNQALDGCLDTLKQLQGVAIVMKATARVDQPGAERMAFQILMTLGEIIEHSGCARPSPGTR
jgi:hypothetical protein